MTLRSGFAKPMRQMPMPESDSKRLHESSAAKLKPGTKTMAKKTAQKKAVHKRKKTKGKKTTARTARRRAFTSKEEWAQTGAKRWPE